MRVVGWFSLGCMVVAIAAACGNTARRPSGKIAAGTAGGAEQVGGASQSSAGVDGSELGGNAARGGSLAQGGAAGADAQPVAGAADQQPENCAATWEMETVQLTRRPVDVILALDNSESMQVVIGAVQARLNAFAAALAKQQVDYRIIVLSLRGQQPVLGNAGTRYPLCVPAPLAGDDACGNGPRFFQSSVDMRSAELLEQVLGTLGQTAGYTQADARGGEPWAQQLRPGSVRHLVLVSDKNARLGADTFLNFAGGKSPFEAGLELPKGLLDPSWGASIGSFAGLYIHGIFSWLYEGKPTPTCTGTLGDTYYELAASHLGNMAEICDGTPAVEQFFSRLPEEVALNDWLSCTFPVPDRAFDPGRLNVWIAEGASQPPHLEQGGNCYSGWYYDDNTTPSSISLCPQDCDNLNLNMPSVEVVTGCPTRGVSDL